MGGTAAKSNKSQTRDAQHNSLLCQMIFNPVRAMGNIFLNFKSDVSSHRQDAFAWKGHARFL